MRDYVAGVLLASPNKHDQLGRKFVISSITGEDEAESGHFRRNLNWAWSFHTVCKPFATNMAVIHINGFACAKVTCGIPPLISAPGAKPKLQTGPSLGRDGAHNGRIIEERSVARLDRWRPRCTSEWRAWRPATAKSGPT